MNEKYNIFTVIICCDLDQIERLARRIDDGYSENGRWEVLFTEFRKIDFNSFYIVPFKCLKIIKKNN